VPLPVALVMTGHEVLRGHTLNTNAAWLGLRATDAGATVVEATTVGDGLEDLARALAGAAMRADCVLVTGGLGPTEDDRTREALARAAGVALEHDARAWEIVLGHFRRLGREPAEVQRRQALLPRGATALQNALGTAPGVLFAIGKATVFLLPGPPKEMRRMFEDEVLPRWRAGGALEETALRVVWTAGATESVVAGAIEDRMKSPEPVVGTHPDEGEVAVRVFARGGGARARADALAAEVVRRLGESVVSTDEGVRIAQAVVALAREQKRIVTTAESITGGLVARMIVEVPGASDVFRGGFVAYSDAWKTDVLGVPAELIEKEGAVSQLVAIAMAAAAKKRTGADLAVATTGVAGPGPDARGTPAGTAFVVATPAKSPGVWVPVRVHALGDRASVQRRVAVAALVALREALRAP
jgi:nicotinamide-nucleotide amidase